LNSFQVWTAGTYGTGRIIFDGLERLDGVAIMITGLGRPQSRVFFYLQRLGTALSIGDNPLPIGRRAEDFTSRVEA
jgi:hypothetical protein